jgi:hypothetical protein
VSFPHLVNKILALLLLKNSENSQIQSNEIYAIVTEETIRIIVNKNKIFDIGTKSVTVGLYN